MRPWQRAVASAGLLWHVGGLLVAPAPPSDLASALWPAYRPYLERLGLNHAWGLFAPEAGPGHVVVAERVAVDGATSEVVLSPGRHASAGPLRRATLLNDLGRHHGAHTRAVAQTLCRETPEAAHIKLVGRGAASVPPERWLAGHRPPITTGDPVVLLSHPCRP